MNLFQTKVANLLGVAGIDVPNTDIQKLMVQHLVSTPTDILIYYSGPQ